MAWQKKLKPQDKTRNEHNELTRTKGDKDYLKTRAGEHMTKRTKRKARIDFKIKQ